MNEYKVNIFADQSETIRADYVHDTDSLLRFFLDDGKEVTVFFKWQYWKFERKFETPSCPKRIKF